MSRLLAFDTATRWGSLALLEAHDAGEVEVVAELGASVPDSHAARLLQRAELLLSVAGWSTSEIDVFVATRGPGSFTGIRIGLGTLRGLMLSTGKPGVGVNTLEAIAEAHGPAEAARLVVLGAGRGELFGACYDAASSPPQELEPPWLGGAERVRSTESRPGRTLVLCGPGAAALLPSAPGDGVRRIAAPRAVAAAAGRLAVLHRATADPAASLAPFYLRAPDVRPPRQG
ncbi:MAG TPA: tRNA (adenosine(37)-N6)-threonylcarbamoyltransferase complex dimerization subunit type 1 TsaB [Candidatus Polarisedimenticolaceae bacterium]|nr:tRNA (adenosine(37)-N6)-threonylcarbamoyltransferase complex dimerization subunit type 1 TsaB [Candidatus Polarisedimenticolaceae bacterium]